MWNELKERTKAFALSTVRLVEDLPRGRSAEVIGHVGIVEEEADQSQFWLELIIEHGPLPAQRASTLRDEAGQLIAIVVTSIRTARGTRDSIPHSALRTPHSV